MDSTGGFCNQGVSARSSSRIYPPRGVQTLVMVVADASVETDEADEAGESVKTRQ